MSPKPKVPHLQHLRERRALSLEEVALKAGVCRSAVSKWERLISEPKPSYRKAYAKMLGISLADLGKLYYEAAP